jgi:predicted nucleotidyltransferase
MVNQSIIETAERFAKLLPSNLMVKKAYLFGSYAKGIEQEESDIDIAIVVGNMPDFFDTQMQMMRVRRKVDLRIEPHPISENEFNASNPFALEIQKTGIELTLSSQSQIASEPKAEYGLNK